MDVFFWASLLGTGDIFLIGFHSNMELHDVPLLENMIPLNHLSVKNNLSPDLGYL